MPTPVYITTPRSSYEDLVKKLRIPKVRRKQLDAIFEAARKRLAAETELLPSDPREAVEKPQSAATR